MSEQLLLAIDAGSSSTRAVLVTAEGAVVAEGRGSVRWKYPRPSWVEMDPRELWQATRQAIDLALRTPGIDHRSIVGVGITSHRETVVMWDRRTGEPMHDAVVWISQQTDDIVRRWDAEGLGPVFEQRTGLRNDSFFSAAKVVWLLENVPGLRERAERGEIAMGTVDCWILWNLTGGEQHATDHSCASRTALFNLTTLQWDAELCARLGIPMSIFADARASDAGFGHVAADIIPSRPPIRAVVADQQAGMFGQACIEHGSAKNTFGTAAVLTFNTAATPVLIPGLTASVGWTVQGTTAYEAEGVVFHSGQTLSWLKDALGISSGSANTDEIAMSVPDTGGVYIVPAFGGMCSPHWDRSARTSISGISLETNHSHVIRAAMEAMVYQTVDILRIPDLGGLSVSSLKVDGGGARSDWLCQFLADIGDVEVVRPKELERTALGCAYIAGIALGIWKDHADAASTWSVNRTFEPQMPVAQRESLYAGWQRALRQVIHN